MIDALLRLDSWVLTRFELLSHFTQRIFGTTSATLVRVFTLIGAALIIKMLIGEHSVFAKVIDLVMMLNRISDFLESYESRPTGLSNHRKITESRGRLPYMTLSGIFLIPDVITGHNMWFEAITAVRYFLACDDLPPGESKVRKFVNSFKSIGHLKPVMEGA